MRLEPVILSVLAPAVAATADSDLLAASFQLREITLDPTASGLERIT